MTSPAPQSSGRATARMANLYYATGEEPGLNRVRQGTGFVYRDSRGRTVRQLKVLDRIRALAIPPAWADVWICARADGHLQATGRDTRGRKQYRYHPDWIAVRDSAKYDRMLSFAAYLPHIRRRVQRDLRKSPESRASVVATVVALLEKTLIRIGNREYAKANGSFGLTTLLDRHVQIHGSSVTFRFRAKSGIMQALKLQHPVLARRVKRCQDLPGETLFQYVGAGGALQSVGSADVNAYLKGSTGRPFTAKDFRTWAGSLIAARMLCDLPAPASAAACARSVRGVIEAVATRLRNTPAVCRKCYVHPEVLEAYRDGVTIASLGSRRATPEKGGLRGDEAALIALLRQRASLSRRRLAA